MFRSLPEPKPDAILNLMSLYNKDSRPNKLDLGVGVYKDTHGNTPVLKAIKQAETTLLETQQTKTYVGLTGSQPFAHAMLKQVFGQESNTEHLCCAQSTGGTGALRIIADALHIIKPSASVWVSDPTWPNHLPILAAAGFETKPYPYYDSERCEISFDLMCEALNSANSGDIVLLHGCCHNPTGADLTLQQWQTVVDICLSHHLFPFFDMAYQGFGDGLEEDAAAIRLFSSQVPELAVAASCSKNFGLYRERTGAAMFQADSTDNAVRALGMLSTVIRASYSMPPDHGANVTHLVLSDKTLRNEWLTELNQMRERMMSLRTEFTETMRKRSNSDRFDYILQQKGMFSRLPLSPAQIEQLREEHGIYIVGDGRINIAGLPQGNMEGLADALLKVMQ